MFRNTALFCLYIFALPLLTISGINGLTQRSTVLPDKPQTALSKTTTPQGLKAVATAPDYSFQILAKTGDVIEDHKILQFGSIYLTDGGKALFSVTTDKGDMTVFGSNALIYRGKSLNNHTVVSYTQPFLTKTGHVVFTYSDMNGIEVLNGVVLVVDNSVAIQKGQILADGSIVDNVDPSSVGENASYYGSYVVRVSRHKLDGSVSTPDLFLIDGIPLVGELKRMIYPKHALGPLNSSGLNSHGQMVYHSTEGLQTGEGALLPTPAWNAVINDRGKVFTSTLNLYDYSEAAKQNSNTSTGYYRRLKFPKEFIAKLRPVGLDDDMHTIAINNSDQVIFVLRIHDGFALVLGTPVGQSGKTPDVKNELAITDIRLSVPELHTSWVPGFDATQMLKQSVYVRGTGSGILTGHWMTRSKAAFAPVSQSIDLVSGKWFKLKTSDISLTYKEPEYDTVQFVIDTPINGKVLATSIEEVALTGFIPSRNGWHYANKADASIDPVTPIASYDGLCLGASESARQIYLKSKGAELPPPQSKMSFVEVIDAWWRPYQSASFDLYSSKDAQGNYNGAYGRVAMGRIPGVPVFTYHNVFNAEARRIRDQITRLQPCTIICLGLAGTKYSHAVLGTASLYSQNIYDPSHDQTFQQMEIFSIYNPNFPSNPFDGANYPEAVADNRFLSSFDTGNPNVFPLLTPDPNDASFKDQVMWVQSNYNHP